MLVALDTLSPDSAAALKLIYRAGLTQAQAADRLEVPEAELTALVASGLRQLAVILQPEARHEPGDRPTISHDGATGRRPRA